jgi:integrase
VAALITATGLRRGEVFQLQSDCLDFENKFLTVKRSYSFVIRKPKAPKGGKLRRIPMNAEVCRLLQRYSCLDPNKRIYEGVDIEHFHKKLRTLCLAAEVPVVGLHDLRDTFASSLVKAGKKLKVIQYLMGHVNVSTTEQYMHLDPNDVESSTDCLETGIEPFECTGLIRDSLVKKEAGCILGV